MLKRIIEDFKVRSQSAQSNFAARSAAGDRDSRL